MQILNGVSEIKSILKDSVVTIGNFDGVHLGHREIISRVVESSRRVGGPAILMTFDPHPRKVLQPEKNLKTIFPREDLENEIKKLGIDILIFEPFSRELSQMSPDDFIQTRIYKPLSPHSLIVGYDFHFGANREGNLEKLKELTDRLKINLEIVSPVKTDHMLVSSSQIRLALANGDVAAAKQMLGRSFYLKGLIVKGKGRGKTIGFPTANLSARAETFPKLGVYATQIKVRGKFLKSITNVGFNPTFADAPLAIQVETYIFNFSEQIYGEEAVVQFDSFVRDEKKFKSVTELVEQIRLDVEMVKAQH